VADSKQSRPLQHAPQETPIMLARHRSAIDQKTPANQRRKHPHGALLALLCAAASGGFVATAQASTTIAEFHVTAADMDLGLSSNLGSGSSIGHAWDYGSVFGPGSGSGSGSSVDFSLDGKRPLGQSFTVSTGHDWDHITFNFYSRDTGEAAAAGHLYLFSAPFTGFGALNDQTAGLLGIGSATGGVYAFDASLRLHADTKYYVYSDEPVAGAGGILWTGYYGSGPRYAGGDFYMGIPVTSYGSQGSVLLTTAYSASPQADAAFKVMGVSAVPEPGALSMLFAGLGALGCISLTRRTSK
jgi:hypothetical protein